MLYTFWAGEAKDLNSRKNIDLFTSKLIYKDGFGRSSYISVYIASHSNKRFIGQL